MWYKFCKKKYDSAIIALWFKPESIANLNIKHDLDKKELSGPEEHHVTMMYIGNLDEIKKDRKLIEKSLENLAKNQKPFKLELGGVAKFFTDKDKKPYVFTVNSPEIEPLRNTIVNTMNAIGIKEPENSPSFVPHMTFGFMEPDNDIDSVKLSKKKLNVDGITLSWGGDLKFFPFA